MQPWREAQHTVKTSTGRDTHTTNEGTRTPPNVLMIVADQLRHDCVGFSGAGLVRTPHIDRIARQGRTFGNCFTAIPTCCPARQALLTGRRPETFGALWNWDSALPVQSVRPSAYTWTRALRDAGYRTGHVGKWHISPEFGPSAFGFDEHVSLGEYRSFRSRRYPDPAPSFDWRGGIDPVDLEDSRTHWLAVHAERFLRDHAGRTDPFLLCVDFGEPHLPCTPVPEYASRYHAENVRPWPSFADDFLGKPYMQLQQLYNWGVEDYTWDEWAPIVARYFAIIEQLDDAVGRILDRLDELGATQNTIVVLTSDHGDMCGAHRMVDKHYVMYEDVVRVPLAICGPSIEPGTTGIPHFVTNVLDLAPTLVELTGVESSPGFHGRSLVPLLRGDVPRDWPDMVVVSYNGQQFGLYSQRMIRTSRWKYVWNPVDQDELYDLDSDPAELHNLVADPDVSPELAGLRTRLLDELVRCGDGLVRHDWLRRQLQTGRKLTRSATELPGRL